MPLVFSERDRNDTFPASRESMFDFLERVAGPFWDRVRYLIEIWVADYCPDSVGDIVGRLQSGDNDQFFGAFWELWLFHVLRGYGFDVICHPEVPSTSRRPDFLASNGSCSFYLEAKLLGDDQPDADRRRRRADLFDQINERVASSRFWVRVEVDEQGAAAPPVRRLAEELQAWLNALEPSEVAAQIEAGGLLGAEGFTWHDERSGWALTFVPMPKNRHVEGDRVLSIFGGEGASAIDDRTPIRKALDAKSRRYGNNLDRPLVIALGIQRAFADDTDVVDALFGDELVIIDRTTGAANLSREPNGLWTSSAGPRRTRLAAVLVCRNPHPWRAGDLEATLWHNPWADEPLQCKVSEFVQVFITDDGALDRRESNGSIGQVLGLGPEWPGPDAPFPRDR